MLLGVDTAEALVLTVAAGAPLFFKTLGGQVELRLTVAGRPDVYPLGGLRLQRLSALSRGAFFLQRAAGALARGDSVLSVARRALAALNGHASLGARARAAGAAAEPPAGFLTLAQKPPTPGPVLSARLQAAATTGFAVVLEGSRGQEATLASLKAQLHRNWRQADRAAPGEVELRLAAGDVLRSDALLLAAEAFARSDAAALYADEEVGGAISAKPGWDPVLAEAYPYTGRPVFFRVPRPPGADHAALLSLARAGHRIGRIPLPLLRRPVAPATPIGPQPRTAGDLDRWPRVTAIVPTRDRADLLAACLTGLERDTEYPDLEIIVVDNGSEEAETLALLASARTRGVRVLQVDEPFNFSRLCNLGAAEATGDLLALVNNDVSPLDAHWLKAMAAQAVRPDVGAVGALLLYEDDTVQHAGIALGPGDGAIHPWRGLPAPAVAAEPAVALPSQRSAVTAACLVLRRELYRTVGGMDETNFPVTLNDVDLCLKIGSRGLRIVHEPRARLRHLEGRTRPPDAVAAERPRRARELAAFRARWAEIIADDPFYSPALDREGRGGLR